jgi:hypothetical protein
MESVPVHPSQPNQCRRLCPNRQPAAAETTASSEAPSFGLAVWAPEGIRCRCGKKAQARKLKLEMNPIEPRSVWVEIE